MRWLIVDARRRYTVLLVAAIAAALLLGWTAWSGLQAKHAGTLRPIKYGDSVERHVALTFDVDRDSAVVVAVLAELKVCEAPATFFVTERWARDHTDLVRQMVADGHAVEASGREYGDMSRLSREQAVAELRQVADGLAAVAGARPTFFRPPAGKYGDGLLEAAISEAMIPVTWTIDSQDWRLGTAAAIVRRVATYARPGAIILLHAGGDTSHTAPALPDMIAQLRKAGLEPVTLQTLLADERDD